MLEKAKILKARYGNSLSTPFLQEILWFHRIKADQDKELLTLEFLNVCAGHAMKGKLFDKELSTVIYRKDMQVRNILYNFPELESIMRSTDEDNVKWQRIETTLQKKLELPYKYEYLKEIFESIFVFFTSVSLLRKASLGLNTSRRWTSKFLFPFSFETLFIDVDNRKESFSMDRRFFSRGGEVLYMMISRAKNADSLKELMLGVFQNPTQNKRWNNLLSTLRGSENIYSNDTQLGFLGADSHDVFDQLVDDLIALLKSNIPHNDLFEHFSSISSFYMVHFILTVALQSKQTSLLKSGEQKIVYPIELLAPRSDHVRRSSRQIYKINEDLPIEALNKVFDEYMGTLVNITDKEELIKKLETELNYKDDEDNFTENINLDKLKDKIWKEIEKKAKSDLISIHRILLKGTGLASVKKTNSYRYLANDDWLKTLVLVNIDNRMPFYDFIDKLYEKYGFIIGNKHSSLLIETYDENDYKKNETRLFERLRALGLLESKSDGYAYVINRYGRK
ncbi:MAG: hypothetical protein WC656_01565 [Sulfurimonas sp.]|jgi:hypothetical protein